MFGKYSFDRIKLWSNHNKNSHINFNLKIEENLLDIKANNRLGHLSIWGRFERNFIRQMSSCITTDNNEQSRTFLRPFTPKMG